MDTDTIVALSTPPGESGIAVIRISGARALSIMRSLAPGLSDALPRQIHRTVLVDRADEPIDDCVCVYMQGPNSYTGADMVEFSCHGSMQIIADIIDEAVFLGARGAEAGEFTRRALINGKMDLSQAEAVADLISAETKLQRQVALEHLEGGLSRKVMAIEDRLLEQLALVEVSIDFAEEELETYVPESVRAEAARIAREVKELAESERAGRKLRAGIKVTILGPSNVGKSMLYNGLLGEERAIVSAHPGTTRDLLRERIHIGGFTFFLEDTAGIAETGCEIEAKGISLGRRSAEMADLVLFVLDGSGELPGDVAAEIARIGSERALCVLNKSDLGLKLNPESVAAELGVNGAVSISALTGEGLDGLKERIYEKGVSRETAAISSERIAVNARQAAAFRDALVALERLQKLLGENAPAEIVSMEIRAAADSCGSVTGRNITGELLDLIFGRFCIGK